jgi:hypothetical protein
MEARLINANGMLQYRLAINGAMQHAGKPNILKNSEISLSKALAIGLSFETRHGSRQRTKSRS